MRNVGLVASLVLLCSVTLVPAFSEDDNQGQDNHQGDNNQGQDNKFDFDNYSNKTLSYHDYSNRTFSYHDYSNKTRDDDDSNKTNIGHEISDYAHKWDELEKEKRNDVFAALKACRQQANNSDNKTALQQCVEDFKLSLKQYHTFVFQQNALFKQFRQGLDHTITQDQNKQNLTQVFSQISHSANTISIHHPNTAVNTHHQNKNHKH